MAAWRRSGRCSPTPTTGINHTCNLSHPWCSASSLLQQVKYIYANVLVVQLDEHRECNNQARKKFTRGHPRQLMSSPPNSLDLRLNISSQSNLGNHWSTVTSLVPVKEVEKEEKEMVAAVCSRCNMLVMLCKSSPSCPNCKFLHHPLQSTFRHYVWTQSSWPSFRAIITSDLERCLQRPSSEVEVIFKIKRSYLISRV